MNEKATEKLIEMADQLGVAVEHLWPVLVAHERMDSIVWVVGGLVVCGIGAGLVWVSVRIWRGWNPRAYLDESRFGAALLGLLALGVVFAGLGMISSNASDVLYPEAAVVRTLLR